MRNYLIQPFFLILLATWTVSFNNYGFAQTVGSSVTGSQTVQIQNKYGVDPNTTIMSRVKPTSPDIQKRFREAGMSPREHKLNKGDSLKVAKAFDALPALHQRILKAHLLSINFLDNMPNTALTSTVNPDDEFPIFTITIRAEILNQNVSQWLTEKEQTCFISTGSPLNVSIEAGVLDAILYVILHETTHVVDGSLKIVEALWSQGKLVLNFPKNKFTGGVWSDRVSTDPKYMDTLLDGIRFRHNGKAIPIEKAQSVYLVLERTPFVSLYASCSWHEDLAEYLTVYHFTRQLKQPFRIIIRDNKREIFIYEPMKSELVRSRIKQMKRFYKNTD
ncbi:MAG: hypothetical protein WDO71_13485 [Bacteroidota bacterium]